MIIKTILATPTMGVARVYDVLRADTSDAAIEDLFRKTIEDPT